MHLLQPSIHHQIIISITSCVFSAIASRDETNSSAHQSGEQQMKNLARLLKDESGVTAIEYGLIAAATGLALVAAMPPIKAGLTTIFGEVSSSLSAK
jgi:pilus assembly protein Flp/PilA